MCDNALGNNFSTDLRICHGYTLVTWGPYRLRSASHVHSSSANVHRHGLLTANWFIGSAGIVVLIVIMISRRPKEEAMMTTFGDGEIFATPLAEQTQLVACALLELITSIKHRREQLAASSRKNF